MKPLRAAAVMTVAAALLHWATTSRTEARLKALVSPEVFIALDAHRQTHGHYPANLNETEDPRLNAARAEAKLHYLANHGGETFEFGFGQPGSIGSQWDIRSDRRSWSLDR